MSRTRSDQDMTTAQILDRERRRQKRLLREKAIYGRDGRLPVGRTKFRKDFVLRDASEPFIPGTSIPRLRPVTLGTRCVAFDEQEVDAVIEALIASDHAHDHRHGPGVS
jgi:hypothetical protein